METATTPSFLLLLAALLCGGCASALTPLGEPDPAAAKARDAIASRGALISTDQMLPTVTLVTPPYGRGTASRRDTLVGIDPVSAWLRVLRTRSQPASRTGLRLGRVLVCEAMAIETGSYPLVALAPDLPSSRRDATGRYTAVWRYAGASWRLEGLWFTPEGRVTAERAPACSEARRRLRASRRVVAGVAVRGAAAADMSGITSQLAGRNWPETTSSTTVVAPGAWLGYRISPEWTARLAYAGLGRSTGAGFGEPGTESITVRGHSLGLLVSRTLGEWVSAGGGPVLARVHTDWRLYTPGSAWSAEEEEWTEFVPGGAAEIQVKLPFGGSAVPVFSLGYGWLAATRAAPPTWSDPRPIPLGGLVAAFGLELAL